MNTTTLSYITSHNNSISQDYSFINNSKRVDSKTPKQRNISFYSNNSEQVTKDELNEAIAYLKAKVNH